MARNNVQMIRLKRMFQLLAAGTPRRTICKRLKIGGGTLWKYEQAAQSQNLSFEVSVIAEKLTLLLNQWNKFVQFDRNEK